MVARELLDVGEPRQAFALCAAAAPASVPAKVDAAFHAGWIALRFLGEAEEAAKRFDAANAVARDAAVDRPRRLLARPRRRGARPP